MEHFLPVLIPLAVLVVLLLFVRGFARRGKYTLVVKLSYTTIEMRHLTFKQCQRERGRISESVVSVTAIGPDGEQTDLTTVS